MSEFSFLEVPEDPPRLASARHRRISALLVDSTKCVGDPRAVTRDDATIRELDFLVSEGLVRVLDRSLIEAAATEQATSSRSFAPADETLDRFTDLLSRLGGIKTQPNAVFMPGHEFVSDSRWFPADRFRFERPFSPERIAEATRAGGPQLVVRRMAEAMYERTAAQLATLQSIAASEGTDLVSSDAVAPMFRAIEESTRGQATTPSYISAGADVLVSTILRHASAIERLEDMPMEDVVALARRLAEPRRRFQKVLRTYAEEVMQSSDPERSADRIYRKHLAPEVEAFDLGFGGIFRTVKSYASDFLTSPTLLTAVPLAATGLAAGINTAWTVAVAGVYSAVKSSSARRAWPRILFELRSRS